MTMFKHESSPGLGVPRLGLLTGMAFLAMTGCDPAPPAETVYVNNESSMPIEIELPIYGQGRSHVIQPHSRQIAYDQVFGVDHPLVVEYWDAETGRKIGTRTYLGQEVDRLVSGETFTVPYPPDRFDPPSRILRRLDSQHTKARH